tara:strand:+ start:300 stop:521 length:222 start_codon:yes stop_codon:yes gene_type:complete
MISINIFFDEMDRPPLSHELKTLRRRVRNSCKTLQKVGLIESKLDYTSKKIPFYTYKKAIKLPFYTYKKITRL